MLVRILMGVLLLGLATPLGAQTPQALELTNVDFSNFGYLRVADHPDLDLQTLTVEAWVTPRGPGYGGQDQYGVQIIGKPKEGSSGFWLSPFGITWSPVTEKVAGYISHAPGSGAVAFSCQTVAPDSTAHLALTFDGETVRVFVNGHLGGEVPYPHDGIVYTDEDLIIGGANFAEGYYRRFDGFLDEIRLWDHARTPAEITGSMHCSLEGTEPGLVAYWDFDDGNAVDVTGHGHDGLAEGPGVAYVDTTFDTTQCGQTIESFRRGDANGDEAVDISDAIFTLDVLFSGGGPVTCQDALDGNDDGAVDIADAIYLLTFLFSGGNGAPPPGPFPCCGADETPDTLGCSMDPGCS